MTDTLRSGISFVYRNYTNEGKLRAMVTNKESIVAFADLRDRLEQSGIPVTEMDEEIKKAAVHMSKDLNEIISNQHKIKINNQTFQVGEELQRKLEGSASQLRIGRSDNES